MCLMFVSLADDRYQSFNHRSLCAGNIFSYIRRCRYEVKCFGEEFRTFKYDGGGLAYRV